MALYRASFNPTFHGWVEVEIETTGTYGIITIAWRKFGSEAEFSEISEIPSEPLQEFTRRMADCHPLFIDSIKHGGLDGIVIDSLFVDDEGNSNEFSVWSPHGNDYYIQLEFINSIYNLACQMFTEKGSAIALKNLIGYFDRR